MRCNQGIHSITAFVRMLDALTEVVVKAGQGKSDRICQSMARQIAVPISSQGLLSLVDLQMDRPVDRERKRGDEAAP